MMKTIKLTENDLTKLVNRIILEQSKQHPMDNPLYTEMTNYIDGDGPEVMKYVPNKMLVISQWDGTKDVPLYTITKH